MFPSKTSYSISLNEGARNLLKFNFNIQKLRWKCSLSIALKRYGLILNVHLWISKCPRFYYRTDFETKFEYESLNYISDSLFHSQIDILYLARASWLVVFMIIFIRYRKYAKNNIRVFWKLNDLKSSAVYYLTINVDWDVWSLEYYLQSCFHS